MQGVRSTRGCIGCRRRKKGCDFRKPTCGRCQRFGVACRYEERQFTFAADLQTAQQSSRGSPPSGREEERHSVLPSSPVQGSLLATDVSLQVDAGFWSIYLPQEDPSLDGSVDGVRVASWLPTVRDLAEHHSNVRMSVQAVAYVGLGWMREDSALVQRGLKVYAQALRETNQMLQDPNQALSDAALACCRTLSLFEMFRRDQSALATGQSQAVDWRSHAEGTFRLLQLRGPERHTSGHGYDLFDAVRLTAVILGVARRQPNGFTSLKWKLPRWKTLRDELFDSMAPLPLLLSHLDEFLVKTSQTIPSQVQDRCVVGIDLLKRCLTICEFLRGWEVRALELCKHNASSSDLNPSEDRSQISIYQQGLANVCLSSGYAFFFTCAQYWTMCLKVYTATQALHEIVMTLARNAILDVTLPDLPPWVNPEPAAHHIANNAAHFFKPEAGLWAAQSAIFPIGSALLYFAQSGRANSEAVRKMSNAFSDNKAGSIMRDFLHSTGMYVKQSNRSLS